MSDEIRKLKAQLAAFDETQEIRDRDELQLRATLAATQAALTEACDIADKFIDLSTARVPGFTKVEDLDADRIAELRKLGTKP